MRDDFSADVKRIVARRVANQCSRPGCGAVTSGPQTDPSRALNVGVAAHITAASPGGPRYDPDLTPEERQGHENAIWLCQTCAKLVDNDTARFTANLVREWKEKAEVDALLRIGKPVGTYPRDNVTDLTDLLRRVQSGSEKTSVYLAEALAHACQSRLAPLEEFAARELRGWYGHLDFPRPPYRVSPVYVSLDRRLDLEHFHWTGNPQAVLEQLRRDPEHFIATKLFFPQEVSFLEREGDPSRSLLSATLRAKDFLPEVELPDTPVYVYGSGDTLQGILRGIRGELTRYLVAAITRAKAG